MTGAGTQAAELCVLFDALFLWAERTSLRGGGEEPVYLPADAACPVARIVFRHDYARSALHEVAHWCIAGAERRQRTDYGYWYAPDGRDAGRQHEFERLETRPQALEWIFSEACGLRFRPSIDNLGCAAADATAFVQAIAQQAQRLHVQGLPPRAERFRAVLAALTRRAAPATWSAAALLGQAA